MDCVFEGNSVNARWFGLAVQALLILTDADHVCPSSSIADNTNAGVTFMRRIMAPLVKANIVEAREGRDGGYLLAKAPELISLAEVYRALQVANPAPSALVDSVDNRFPHAESLHKLFIEIAERTEEHVLSVLKGYTIADLSKRIK